MHGMYLGVQVAADTTYAVSDRIDFSGLSERVVPTLAQDPEQVALSLLPIPEDDEAIRNNMCTLISHIMYENMDFEFPFQCFV